MPFTNINGIKVYYEVHGGGETKENLPSFQDVGITLMKNNLRNTFDLF